MAYWLWKLKSVSCTVAFSSPGRKYSGLTKSLKTVTDCTTITVIVTDRSSGKMTLKNTRSGPAPSMIAASSSSRGIVAMNARNSRMQNDSPNATSIRISPGSVLNRLSSCSTQTVGTTAGGMISPLRIRRSATLVHRLGRRCST